MAGPQESLNISSSLCVGNLTAAASAGQAALLRIEKHTHMGMSRNRGTPFIPPPRHPQKKTP